LICDLALVVIKLYCLLW